MYRLKKHLAKLKWKKVAILVFTLLLHFNLYLLALIFSNDTLFIEADV